MATETLPTDGRSPVRLTSRSGPIRVIAEERGDVAVPEGTTTTRAAGVLTIAGDSDALEVRVPRGTDLVIGSEGARVRVEGEVGAVAVVTTSGRASVSSAASADVRTTSGRVDIGTATQAVRVRTQSGTVAVDACGQADVATESGRIRLRGADGPVHAHCTSGRIDITLLGAHAVDAETVSGRIEVQVPPGVESEVLTDLEAAGGRAALGSCVITARSVSGRIKVTQR